MVSAVVTVRLPDNVSLWPEHVHEARAYRKEQRVIRDKEHCSKHEDSGKTELGGWGGQVGDYNEVLDLVVEKRAVLKGLRCRSQRIKWGISTAMPPASQGLEDSNQSEWSGALPGRRSNGPDWALADLALAVLR
ncbi:hypothetical protein SRHO_G00218130 [Serrasalmus rhombeus]